MSAVVRSIFAWQHSTARYFPDEYIYAELGRSIAHGHLEIHGRLALFPALLEPILAAPLWRFFSLETAYHLVQVENAAAASLVAVPVYLLARRLRLGSGYALLCSLYALVVPMLAMAPLTVSDFVAYPLVLAAVAAGVDALDRPTARGQVAFLAFASLATFARVQYFVLVPAYLVAATCLERRRVLRRHRIAFAAVAPAVLGLVVALTGFYSGVSSLGLGWPVLTWFALHCFLLTLVAGVVIVPGAVAGLIRPGDRRRTAFALLAAPLAVLLVAEASVYAADSGRFKERYVFALLPLLPIAFGIYLDRRRPYGRLTAAVAIAVGIAAARLPLSAYATNARRYDSQFLTAADWFQTHTSVGSSSLAVALAMTALALWAVFIGFRRGGGVAAVVVATALTAAAGALACHVDLVSTAQDRQLLPPDKEWIDHATQSRVTAIATPYSNSPEMALQLYWNPSVGDELRLDGALPTDEYASDWVRFGRDGALLGVRGDVLVDAGGSRMSFANGRLIRRFGEYDLWQVRGRPRASVVFDGVFARGWLAANARLRAWPRKPVAPTGTVHAVLQLATQRKLPFTARAQFGSRWFSVPPGRTRRIECTGPATGLDVNVWIPQMRFAGGQARTIRLESLKVTSTPAAGRAPRRSTTCAPVG